MVCELSSNSAVPKRRPHTMLDASERRAEIVQTARELYEEQGLAHTTIQDITSRMGVARSLFYHYFPDKDAVTTAVLDAYVEDYLEALHYWNENRRVGDIDHALRTLTHLLRTALFEKDSFRAALASRENAALYIEFINRVAEQTAQYLIDSTVRDYQSLHEVRIDHLYETFYLLIVGIISYTRRHPEVPDEVVCDLIAQTLHMDRNVTAKP